MVCLIVFSIGGLFFLLIIFPCQYNLFWGLILTGGGALAGMVYFYIFNYRGSVFFFTTAIGVLSGACFANQIYICILFQQDNTIMIINYAICTGLFFTIAHFFHYNAFNILISWCGAFFLVRGITMAVFADSFTKGFLYHRGFENGKNGFIN